MLYMAAPVATSAIKTNRTNVIGCGLKLNSRIDAERLGMSQEAAKEWQSSKSGPKRKMPATLPE